MRLKFRPDHALLDGFDSFSGLRACAKRTPKGPKQGDALRRCIERSYNQKRVATSRRGGRK